MGALRLLFTIVRFAGMVAMFCFAVYLAREYFKHGDRVPAYALAGFSVFFLFLTIRAVHRGVSRGDWRFR